MLGVCAKLVDEGTRRMEMDRVKVDAGTQLDQSRSDEPMFFEDGACGSLVDPKELGNEKLLLGRQMHEELAIEPNPDLGDLLPVVLFEGREDLLEECFESTSSSPNTLWT